MSGHALSIVTYDCGVGWDDLTKKKPYHWAFFLQTGTAADIGPAFQLPGSLYYSIESADLSKPESKNGRLKSVSSL